MIDPIRKTVIVPLTARDAFDLFTKEIDAWWPKDTYSVAADERSGQSVTVHIEGGAGGRITERHPDGSETTWARITTWEPGERLSLEWHPNRDPQEATQVDVVFQQEESGTRVDLVHDGFDRLGESGATMCDRYDQGWNDVLGRCFRGHCVKLAA